MPDAGVSRTFLGWGKALIKVLGDFGGTLGGRSSLPVADD